MIAGIPPLALRIAITGHRWDRIARDDGPLLLERTQSIFGRVTHHIDTLHRRWTQGPSPYYAPDRPAVIRALSGLAEGGDRIGAEAALANHLDLQVVLPFPRMEYLSDFATPESRAEFDVLLSKASAVQVLQERRPTTGGYIAVGDALLRHADILLAYWDGGESRGPGGTVEILQAAQQHDIPVIVVDTSAPHQAWLLDLNQADTGRAAGCAALEERLTELLSPPLAATDPDDDPDLSSDYAHEPLSTKASGRAFDIINAVACPGHGRIAPVVSPGSLADHSTSVTAEWGSTFSTLPEAVRTFLMAALAPAFARADGLAIYYASRYRTTFSWGFLLSTLAVPTGLWVILNHGNPLGLFLSAVEILLLGTVGHIIYRGRRARYHARWIQYRSLAERIRHLGFLLPLGLDAPSLRGESQRGLSGRGGPGKKRFVPWMLRAVVRSLGLLPGSLSTEHQDAGAAVLAHQELDGQRRYHQRVAKRNETLHHRLHTIGLMVYALALTVAVTDLALQLGVGDWLHHSFPTGSVVLVNLGYTLTVFLPAFAAAVHGFLSQGEFLNTARRSRRILDRLEQLHRELIGAGETDRTVVTRVAALTAEVLERELDDWQAEYSTKSLDVTV